jgi:nitroreductase
MFTDEGPMGYQAACAAAIQNMNLAAHAMGLSSLWFTLFDKKALREILSIAPEKIPLALICLGKPVSPPVPVPRKEVKEKAIYIR